MKIILITIILSSLSVSLFSQNEFQKIDEKRKCITIGVLQGGGSIIGADFEILLTRRIGIQAGAGYIGFGGGLNYHFKPTIRSSFISFQYWHQGVGDTFTQSLLGPSYVFRGRKWLTFQIGLGTALEEGPALPDDYEQPPVMLLYSIGAYIPLY